jgi:hypothetical protein
VESNRFYLGTHQVNWLATAGVPLFVSARRLRSRVALPRAAAPWALDSGGFTELSLHGEWTVSALSYAMEAERWAEAVGAPDWCAPQDWMCEPAVLARTGLTVARHQARTVANYRDLLGLAPSVPWAPVLQGWTRDDYLRCLDLYDAAGFDLRLAPVVGLGTVCRRQGTREAEEVVRELAGMGLRLHAFGYKLGGLRRSHRWLESADSMAWSYAARRSPPLPGCTHRSCANCLRYALRWRGRVLDALAGPCQATLF